MGMDRNTVIGFVLIGVLLVAMLFINNKSRQAFENEPVQVAKRKADSLAAAQLQAKQNQQIDTSKAVAQSQNAFQQTGLKADSVVLENELVKIVFDTKGAQPQRVVLKNYKKFDSTQVVLQQGNFNNISYKVNESSNHTIESSDILFAAQPVVVNADKSQTVSFVAGDSTGRKIIHQYTIRPNDYMIDFTISVNGADNLFSGNMLNLRWQTEAEQIEKDHKYEATQTEIGFVKNNEFDFERLGSGGSEDFTKPVDWIGTKQQFFITALAAKSKFSSASVEWKAPADTNSFIVRTTVNAHYAIAAGPSAVVPLQLYYGPSDYNILKKYDNKMQNMVPYGSGIFSFVKYINRHFLLPVFNFLQSNIASMGIVILLLTLLIRLITSPILYKSYLSGAKMKVLKPEVDALKEKFKDPKTGELDQQAFSMEQMKLWRTAGVSPLGGCLPALLQIPIFMSLYYFFQSNIDLRGKNFLWASDLAAYDSIAKLPFSIPFYGDHVSLFTLTAVITSLIISIYSMNNMQDNNNPVMKYMPYIFPVLLLGVFNNLPAALTWYYTVSNSITLILQIVIQKYIINHDKILAQIAENRKKPVKKSKLAERMEAMQEQQKKLQEQKNKSTKK
ncbi:membrane protein insertase YidC [Ferruginibacter sp. HRS2-29]|uniref:membrane protein insertase YidC n=1 Tax=Ferruginibacter sp. HRS2-29 TaxID=2487334 RepID=UPI0020CBE2E5|nr:membrane protein insertase YidC [Ferruginibacter sp. HRS2-29]MCP9753316.1 membrane protein insertase YidC [Ferruginibacter sp. HRS2-29]